MEPIALYIHIPFCVKKCAYCDFNSFAAPELMPSYLSALKKEMGGYKAAGYAVKTVYMGGGTPTILNQRDLASLIQNIHSSFYIAPGAEFTVEANPGTLTKEKLLLLKHMGVNRLSIGLQAYQDRLLKVMGRIHTVKDFEESFALARQAGFDNINVDVIFGLPGQTLFDFKETLKNLVRLSPEHISCYALSVEEGTEFYNWLKQGRLFLPPEDEERAMYHEAVTFLKSRGFVQYEISNFAKPGRESRHNLAYWRDEEYLGLGAGAHSFLNGERFYNRSSLKEYIECLEGGLSPVEGRELLDKEALRAEFCFLGLRLTEGISKTDFKIRFGKDLKEVYGKAIERLKNFGLLQEDGERLKLTSKGLDLANEVFMEFLP
jgi:oxygen-independent coproporphyrinogen-3 oxidase